jgi:hypothetical protein
LRLGARMNPFRSWITILLCASSGCFAGGDDRGESPVDADGDAADATPDGHWSDAASRVANPSLLLGFGAGVRPLATAPQWRSFRPPGGPPHEAG